MELFFLRHGVRIDHERQRDPSAMPIHPSFPPWDPLLAQRALAQIEAAANDFVNLTTCFPNVDKPARKNIYIHFSPYLRTCETADLLVSALKPLIAAKFPQYKVRFQLLGDFALSEWIHDLMKVKPPYVDNNDAYDMYTPNLKLIKNKNCVLNFRPTVTLGPFNGPDLLYQQYLERSKEYFTKLIATYDKPAAMNNRDIVIVVGHGYMINHFLLFFISHPIFQELPEATLNYARREEDEPEKPWHLIKDSVGLIEKDPLIDLYLNFTSDIVYYKTTFVKKDEIDDNGDIVMTPASLAKGNMLSPWLEDRPRPLFKLPISQLLPNLPTSRPTPVCAAARDWTPQQANKFRIKHEFALKAMHDDIFKKTFDLNNHPLKPVTPEVSPLSEPLRQNLVIDLTKLNSNDEIHHPLKLRYSTTSDIPISTLNNRLNTSQLNLAQFLREDLYSLLVGTSRNRLNLGASDHVFRLHRENLIDLELDSIPEGRVLRNPSRKTRTPLRLLHSELESLPLVDSTEPRFALQFAKGDNAPDSTLLESPLPNQVKLVSSTNPPKEVSVDSAPERPTPSTKANRIFYQLDESSLGSEDDEDSNFVWFGENLKHK